jgi:hypothetical protein
MVFGGIGKACTLRCLFQSFMPQDCAYVLMQLKQLLLIHHQHQFNRHHHMSLTKYVDATKLNKTLL